MRRMALTAFLALLSLAAVAQQGINYQAALRGADGQPLANREVGLRLTLLDGSNTVYQETQTATTSPLGVLNVAIGDGNAQQGEFAKIDWSQQLTLQVEVNADGQGYVALEATPLRAVPQAHYARQASSLRGADERGVSVSAPLALPEDSALFEVRNKRGQVVFAVYENGTRVYVDESSRGTRGGFAVAGFDSRSGRQAKDFFVVTPDSTRVYVNGSGQRGTRGGFAVAGFDSRAGAKDMLVVTPDSTRIYVDGSGQRGTRGGFAVAGFDSRAGAPKNVFFANTDSTRVYVDGSGQRGTRGGFAVAGFDSRAGAKDMLVVTQDSTRIYVDGNGQRGTRGGFAVAGFDSRAGGPKDVFFANADSTRVYVDADGSRSPRGGFAVAGRLGRAGDNSDGNNLFKIDVSQTTATINGQNRVYWYPNKNAFLAGNLLVTSPDDVGTNSFSVGYQSKASGSFAQALGYKSVASGETSTAIGNQSQATGESSFAFGKEASAEQMGAVAMGITAKAQASNAFAIGNGAAATKSGSYAIGSNAKASGINSFAFGSEGQDSAGVITTSAVAGGDYSYAFGQGVRSSGRGAFAMGTNAVASGNYCLSLGYGTKAEGTYTTAMGYKTSTSGGSYSTAIGRETKAKWHASFAAGDNSQAIANAAFAMGDHNIASGIASAAIGSNVLARSYGEIALGIGNTDYTPTAPGYIHNGDRLLVVGNGYYQSGTLIRQDALTIYKNGAIQMGDVASNGIYTLNINTTRRGLSVSSETTAFTYALSSTAKGGQRAFALYGLASGAATNYGLNVSATGTGTTNYGVYASASGASTNYAGYFSGDVKYTGALTGPSDIRLKKDVQTLDGALNKVIRLRGVSYQWKSRQEMASDRGIAVDSLDYGYASGLQIGVIAQEIETVLPEIVQTDELGFKSVDYTKLAPVLVEAIKEQQQQIDKQQQRIEKLEQLVEQLLKK